MKKRGKKHSKVMLILIIISCIFIAVLLPSHKKGTESEKKRSGIFFESGKTIQSEHEQDAQKKESELVETETAVNSVYDSTLQALPEPTGNNGSVKIGNITINYNTGDAAVATGSAAGARVSSLLFNDGNELDIKGYIFAVEAFQEDKVLQTLDDAKACVGEYLPAGSGVSSEWETTKDFFCRKAVGYDAESQAAFYYISIVPKNSAMDRYMYSIILIKNNGTENIKKSSFRSITQPMKTYIPGSNFLCASYDTICNELDEVLLNKSATGDTMGGLSELRLASEQWYYDVFGVDDIDSYNALSDEEKSERYWKYKDPVGYSQAKRIENSLAPDAETPVEKEELMITESYE